MKLWRGWKKKRKRSKRKGGKRQRKFQRVVRAPMTMERVMVCILIIHVIRSIHTLIFAQMKMKNAVKDAGGGMRMMMRLCRGVGLAAMDQGAGGGFTISVLGSHANPERAPHFCAIPARNRCSGCFHKHVHVIYGLYHLYFIASYHYSSAHHHTKFSYNLCCYSS